MSSVTNGLVLKVSDIGESDKVITLLTAEMGVIRAFANRAKKMNSNIRAASQLLCYGEFTLYHGRDSYIIENAVAKEVFFGLRSDIKKLALAQYFCSLALEFVPEGEPAPDTLRLILNSLSYLQNGRRSPEFIKAVTELKLISLAGYAPDVSACGACGKSFSGEAVFNVRTGKCYCPECSENGMRISPGVITAMQYVVFNGIDRIYSFSLPAANEKLFGRAAEDFLLFRTGKTFKALEFYKSVST